MPTNGPSALKRTWDTDTAAVVLTLGALGFLWLVRRGFRPVLAQ